MGRSKVSQSGRARSRKGSNLTTLALDDLLVEGRLGPLQRGATRADVLRIMGPPDAHAWEAKVECAPFWAYGDTCFGHLEFHFLENDALRSIFSDYLPIRRHRGACFELDPGCLGGRHKPSLHVVLSALARCGVHAMPTPRDPRWSDAAPPANVRRVPVRDWKKLCGALDRDRIEETFYAEVLLPSGVVLGVGSEIATLSSGERVAKEDVIIVMSALMIG